MPPTEYRVYGPPGTGKTTYIADQIKVLADRFGSDQVSVCSLTNTAIKEAIGRDLPIDPENASTLHARCKRALQATSPAESHVREFIQEFPQHSTEACLPASLIRQGMDQEDRELILFGSRSPSLYEEIQILRQQMIPEASWRFDLRDWWKVWKYWMDSSGRMDFTGWLETAMRESVLPPQQVLFVDEAQDHTPLQLAVIRSWKVRHRVLVGDDDQNLYEWSGAVPDRFFSPSLPESHEKVLSRSWRVPRSVFRFAQKWVRQISVRKDKTYHPKDKEGEVAIGGGIDLRSIKAGILPDLDRAGTHMFLASSAYMLADICQALQDRDIPFHNPFRKSNSSWNPLQSASHVLSAYRSSSWSVESALSWMKVLRSKDVYLPNTRESALSQVEQSAKQVLTEADVLRFFIPEMQRKIKIRDLSIFNLRRANALGNWSFALKVIDKSPTKEISPKIIVGTIHSVKGGEADHVYLFPDLSPSGFADYLSGNRDRISRLMYVGMTRAAETLVLADPSSRKSVVW